MRQTLMSASLDGPDAALHARERRCQAISYSPPFPPSPAAPPPPYGPSITLEAAKKAMAAAEAEATKNNWNVVITIVDAGGHVVMMQRANNTQYASIGIAEGKARTRSSSAGRPRRSRT